jgi:hypothetical protein
MTTLGAPPKPAPTPLSPSNQTRATAIEATRLGARLWRVSVGLAWIGEKIAQTANSITLRNPRPFRAGVKGMSDSLGFVPVTITPEMVGTKLPVFLAIENKSGSGRLSTEQRAYIAMVRSFGGRAGVSRCDEDTAAILRGEIRD